MNVDDLKALMNALSKSSLSEVIFEDDEFRVRVAKQTSTEKCDVKRELKVDSAHLVDAEEVDPVLHSTIRPMIAAPTFGLFFRSASPDDPPLVEIGSFVEIGQAVAVIEAMKTFTSVTSDKAGTITAVFFQDGDMVQEGQAMFELDLA